MSSLKTPSTGASPSGSSRRHSIDTICHPVAVRCRMISGLKGEDTTSLIRSKYAITHLSHGAIREYGSNSAAKFAHCFECLKYLTEKVLGGSLALRFSCQLSRFASLRSFPDRVGGYSRTLIPSAFIL